MAAPINQTATVASGASVTGDLILSNCPDGKQGVLCGADLPSSWVGTVTYLQVRVPMVDNPASDADYADLKDEAGNLVRLTISGATSEPRGFSNITPMLRSSMYRIAMRDSGNLGVPQTGGKTFKVQFRPL